MDGLPRISILSLPLKHSSEQPDLSPMAKDIEVHYQHSSEMYNKEFSDFLLARKAACEPSIDYTGISKQKRYYAQLQLVKGRFKFSAEENTAVLWTWNDAFSNSAYESLDVGFEEAAILFNISALHTILGAKEKRIEADSMKVACTHFQCAAWALESFAERHYSADASGDLNTDLIRALASLLIAQAQECIVEKSVLDGRPANITAKLAQYLAQAYEQITSQLSSSSVVSSLPTKYQKDWRRRCQVKSNYYAALVAYFTGVGEENEQKFGKAIAWLQVAEKHITEAEKMVKELKETDATSIPLVHGGPLRVNVQFVADAIRNKLPRLIKDNDFIYHEVVPAAETLEPVRAACLVKGVPFNPNDPEIRGPDIFQRLVPMKTLEASSVYSEHKAALLRGIAAEVDDKEAEIQLFLTSIDLDPESMMQPDTPVPQEVYDTCTQVGALEHSPERELSNQMQKLATESSKVEAEAQQLAELIGDVKVRLDALSTVKSDDRVKSIRSQLSVVTERSQGLTAMIQTAKNSNIQLREILGMHLETLQRFTTPIEQLIAQLPSVKSLLEDDSVQRTMTEAKRLFDKVNEMRRQRTDLINQLREELHQDDIIGDLLATAVDHQSGLEELFKTRLTKHDRLVGLLRQNLSAQENIESALLDLNADFAPQASKLRELRHKRADELQKLVLSGKAFTDVVQKCHEALRFYDESSHRLNDLQRELDQLTERLNMEESHVASVPPSLHATSTTAGSATPGSATPWSTTVSAGAADTAAASQIRPGSIPTLGDYMASMKQRRPVPGMVGQNPIMAPSWPIPTVTSIPSYPNPNLIPGSPSTVGTSTTSQMMSAPPGQLFRPQHPSTTMFNQPSSMGVPNQLGCTEYPRNMPPGGPSQLASAQFPSSQPVKQLDSTTPTAHQPPSISQPTSSALPQPGTYSSSFSGTQPNTTSMTGSLNRPDLLRANLPGPQSPYGGSSVTGGPGSAPSQSHPGQLRFQGPPGQPHSTFGHPAPGPYPQRPPTMSQLPSQPISHGQPMNTQTQAPSGVFRPVTHEFQNPMHTPMRTGPPENPPSVPLSTSGYYTNYPPFPRPADPSNPHRMPFSPGGIPCTGPVRPFQSPQQPFSGMPSGNDGLQHQRMHFTQPQPAGIPSRATYTQPGSYIPPQATGMHQFYSTGSQAPQPPPPPQPVQQQPPQQHQGQYRQPQLHQLSVPPPQQHQLPVLPPPPPPPPPLPQQQPQTQMYHASPNASHPGGTLASQLPASIVDAGNTTGNNVLTNALCPPDSAPLQPQVLTKADLDAQRREDRLRATYGNSPVPRNSIHSGPTGENAPTSSTEPKRSHDGPGTGVSQQHASVNQRAITQATLQQQQKQSDSVLPVTDPLSDPLVLNPFIAATENLLTWLEHLHDPVPSDSKPGTIITRLDKAWTKVQAIAAERSASGPKKPTQAAAMCCPAKNRRQDCVPYDANRVVLDNPKNDYINASHIDFLNCFGDWCPRYIVTQAPMQKTVGDFWHMILSQGCEVVVFLPPMRASRSSSPMLAGLNDWPNPGEGGHGDPNNPLAIPPHLPTNKVGSRFPVPGSYPPLELRLQALKNCDQTSRITDSSTSATYGYTERILTVRNTSTEQTRSLVHLTYHGPVLRPTSPPHGVDLAVEPLCAFVSQVHTYYKQQRSLLRPIAVVCEYGAGLSGIFVAASVGLLHAERLGRLADCVDVAGRLLQQRRGLLSQPAELVSAARIIAHAAVEAAAKRDIVVGPRHRSSTSSRTPELSVKKTAVGSIPPVVNPVDSLFSNQPIQIGELLNVVDRWNLGGVISDTKSKVNGSRSDCEAVTAEAQEVHTVTDSDGVENNSVENGSHVNLEPNAQEPNKDSSQDADIEIDRLVDLSALGSDPGSGRRRYRRQDFESGTRPIAKRTEADSSDPFSQLDPFQALAEFTDSPVP